MLQIFIPGFFPFTNNNAEGRGVVCERPEEATFDGRRLVLYLVLCAVSNQLPKEHRTCHCHRGPCKQPKTISSDNRYRGEICH